MKIQNATFITSVASSGNFYKTNKPIIAVAGKSNVGKSSLINMLAGQKKLAKTSTTPGRTRLINYFDFGSFVLADLPGYGFAKVSKEEKDKWGELMESFLANEKIALLLSLVDIRHEPTMDDKMMIQYLNHYAIPFELIATKADKLPKTKINLSLQVLATSLCVGVSNITATSSETAFGKDKVLNLISNAIAVTKNNNE